jgi:uncharacterized protein (TIRG00374 family)
LASVFGWIFSNISPRDVATSLRSASLPWLAVYATLAIVLSLLRTVRYRILLRAAGFDAPAPRLFLAVLVRGFCVDMLPARSGELVYIALLRARLGIPTVSAAANFGAAFLLDLAALGPLILAAAVMLGAGPGISAGVVVAGGAIILAVSLSILLFLPAVLSAGSRIAASLGVRLRLPVLAKAAGMLAEVRSEVARMDRRGTLFAAFLLSLGVRICKYAALYALLAALLLPRGYTLHSMSPARVFVGLCSAEMAASLPMSGVAGFGAYEGTWALVFALLGFSKEMAMTTGVTHHLVTQIFAATLGIAAAIILWLVRPLPVRAHKQGDAGGV